MTDETKYNSSGTNEALNVSPNINEGKSDFVSGATFDHAVFDDAEFDQVYDTALTPFTNETKNP